MDQLICTSLFPHPRLVCSGHDGVLCDAESIGGVNAIGTQLCDPINSGMVQWRLTIYVDAVAESGRNPVSKCTRFSLIVENEQADARRDGQTCLARPNSQARTRTGKIMLSLFS